MAQMWFKVVEKDNEDEANRVARRESGRGKLKDDDDYLHLGARWAAAAKKKDEDKYVVIMSYRLPDGMTYEEWVEQWEEESQAKSNPEATNADYEVLQYYKAGKKCTAGHNGLP